MYRKFRGLDVWFLANVHVRYMLSLVRLSSVCNAHAPYQAVGIFGNVSTPFGTVAIH